ncbi:unnamed protein product [Caenorhabditis auriculariae]|uniref:Globin domain-containing protein n=1 Tax=Caenorhabditis auriculariae TaxID=2777116 RepID=A0A8S1H294_9PELO|nr:unnamed protein product [Caenorhabditis auriculariae]
MGAEGSKCPHESLAEKRYKIERPKKKRASSSVCGETALQASHTPKHSSIGDAQTTSRSSIEPSVRSREPSDNSENDQNRELESLKGVPCKHFLTRRERVLLEQSWRKTKKTGADHVGAKIFFMVLTAQPDIKAIFGLEKIPTGRLKYDPRFRQHALVYTKTLDYVIRNIEFPGKIEVYFESLGKRHVALQGRGFNPVYWETFAECMTQAAVEWEANRQRPTLGAWRNLISCIISFMRGGFDEEKAKGKTYTYTQPYAGRTRRPAGSYAHFH